MIQNNVLINNNRQIIRDSIIYIYEISSREVDIMKNKLKLIVLTILSVIGITAATASAGACWMFSFYQPECPKTLLK